MADLLVMGPCESRSNPGNTGGAVVLFTNLLRELDRAGVDYLLIDTRKENYRGTLHAYFAILGQLFIKQFRVRHISLHSSRDYQVLAPFVIAAGLLPGRSTSLRKFGGEAWDTYSNASGMKKRLLHFIFSRVDFLFLEMRHLVQRFGDLNPRCCWFPNVRRRPEIRRPDRPFARRFVFLGHVMPEKGIDDIVAVRQMLGDDYQFDIYGIIRDERYSEGYFRERGIAFGGAISPDAVAGVLADHDVLLLPSYKEGYPGVIIEAYSVGLPVISTQLRGVQEIVEEGVTGLLVEPGNVEQLYAAVTRFDAEEHDRMAAAALRKFDLFDSQRQTARFLDIVLAGNRSRCSGD